MWRQYGKKISKKKNWEKKIKHRKRDVNEKRMRGMFEKGIIADCLMCVCVYISSFFTHSPPTHPSRLHTLHLSVVCLARNFHTHTHTHTTCRSVYVGLSTFSVWFVICYAQRIFKARHVIVTNAGRVHNAWIHIVCVCADTFYECVCTYFDLNCNVFMSGM